MSIVPIDAEQSPLLVLELLFKLRVRDVMTRDLVTVDESASLRTVQRLMKEHGITGVPVVEDAATGIRRLKGLVSIDDIIRALDEGFIDDAAGRRMTTRVVVLEEEMPLSIAVAHFRRYPFGRFPVLDREQRLVGIVTSRNVNASLLEEVFKELGRREAEPEPAPRPGAERAFKVFPCRRYDFENAGKAANRIKEELQRRRVASHLIRRVAVAAYELEMNQVVHSEGGTLACYVTPERVEIVAQDGGPGIADVEQAMQEGFTTANDWIRSLGFGAGMGLPNARRVSDEFELRSAPGAGTTVRAVVELGGAAAGGPGETSR